MIMRRRILVIALLGMVVVLPALTVAIAPRLAANPPWNVQSWFEQVYPTYTPMPSGRPEQNYIPTQASLEEALALLEKAISAMSEVKSYHFVLLNHEDLQGSEQFPHDRE